MSVLIDVMFSPKTPLDWTVSFPIGLFVFFLAVNILLVFISSISEKLWDWTSKYVFLSIKDFMDDSMMLFGDLIRWPLKISGYLFVGGFVIKLFF